LPTPTAPIKTPEAKETHMTIESPTKPITSYQIIETEPNIDAIPEIVQESKIIVETVIDKEIKPEVSELVQDSMAEVSITEQVIEPEASETVIEAMVLASETAIEPIRVKSESESGAESTSDLVTEIHDELKGTQASRG